MITEKNPLYRFIIIVFLLAFLTLLICSCAETKDVNQEKNDIYCVFTDSCGNTVTLNEKPQRVAVLFSSFADIWQLAGGSVDITVGESVERGFADSSAVLVDDGAGKAINTELLINADPDFVICSADIEAQAKAARLLSKADIPTAQFKVESFKDYLGVLDICTDITGCKDNYQKYGTEVAERIEALLEKTDKNFSEKRILFIRCGSSASSTKAKKASDHFAAAMLEELGAYNIADNAPVLLDGLSIEEIISEDPDYIFISTMGNDSAARSHMESVLAEPAWQNLSAIKEKRYVYLPKELFQFKPNARWDKAYEFLIKNIYEKN